MLFAVKNTNKDEIVLNQNGRQIIISSVTFYNSVIKAIEKSMYSFIVTALEYEICTNLICFTV